MIAMAGSTDPSTWFRRPRERVETRTVTEGRVVRYHVLLDGELRGVWEQEFTADVYAEGIVSGLLATNAANRLRTSGKE